MVRAWGVESEMELAFAGLHQLCVPMLGRLDQLPGPQRDALVRSPRCAPTWRGCVSRNCAEPHPPGMPLFPACHRSFGPRPRCCEPGGDAGRPESAADLAIKSSGTQHVPFCDDSSR